MINQPDVVTESFPEASVLVGVALRGQGSLEATPLSRSSRCCVNIWFLVLFSVMRVFLI